MKAKFLTYFFILSVMLNFFFSCAGIPEGAEAVTPFYQERYLGKWYEIARLDFKYERDMDNTTAVYSLNDDGSIQVVNRGYHTVKKAWSQVTGRAKFVGDKRVAQLKVSFFGPFYGGYNVIALDDAYQYALVTGNSLDYLWILSRQPQIPEDIKTQYLHIAAQVGYQTDDLIWVHHDPQP